MCGEKRFFGNAQGLSKHRKESEGLIMKQTIGAVTVRSNKRDTRALIVYPTGRRVLVSMPQAHDQALSLVTGLKVRSCVPKSLVQLVVRSLEETAV